MTGAPLSYADLPEEVLAEIFAAADRQAIPAGLPHPPYADQIRLTLPAARAERKQAA